MSDIEDIGIDRAVLQRYIEEQIYTLPGTDGHRQVFSILLTGSRAFGTHTPASDVDIDVACPRSVYDSVHRASVEAGIIKSPDSFFVSLPGDDWHRYYGEHVGRPHFSLTVLEDIERRFREYDDVALWIWTHAATITDPGGQFRRIRDSFRGYPKDVLVRKIKYRWLLAWYWAIMVYPHHHSSDEELLPAATAMLNAVNELIKFFFLVEGKPFPYAQKLMPLLAGTKLGREFGPVLRQTVDLVVGKAESELPPWERLDRAFDVLCPDTSEDPLEKAGYEAMIAAGVDRTWVEADFNNIDDLLLGRLGPPP